MSRRSVLGAGCPVRPRSRFIRSWLLLSIMFPAVAAAQTTDRIEVGGGVRWIGGASLADVDATLDTASGGTFVQFGSESELGSSLAVEGRFAVRLTRSLHAEASLSYGTADLRTELNSDVESIPDTTVSEPIERYTFEGALVASLDGWRRGLFTPFVTVGGGYLRELHEGRTLVETGGTFHAGGGIALPIRTRPAGGTALGIRVDLRAVMRSGGVQFDDDLMVVPAAGASLFLRF